ncbi:Dual specificity protein phosphatase [Hyella patelloides LEGE 07179]|uniref:Dual specificity protein phosphatase n=1 Tax=Hyella patelloides LEGE 07179 TaxID=945734 RepID=A0A563W532_9CYAN|nr:dual specificity protein phosphatase family protein [Hyella patelloides]VEP18819.1 Dual specificity protein phosphatase [Hyella patelloides LEGE 07179]
MYKFAAAEHHESFIYGAAKPKYRQKAVEQWIKFLQGQKIEKVCCLLQSECLNRYEVDLLKTYREKFGKKCVLWQSLQDFQIPQSQVLIESIIPFLISADEQRQKIVVHCSGGIGRTGIVLAAWLVSRRGFSNQDAIFAVKQNKRNPDEAVIAALFRCQNPHRARRKLDCLLNDCRNAFY